MRIAAASLRIPWPEWDACRYARLLLLLFHIAFDTSTRRALVNVLSTKKFGLTCIWAKAKINIVSCRIQASLVQSSSLIIVAALLRLCRHHSGPPHAQHQVRHAS